MGTSLEPGMNQPPPSWANGQGITDAIGTIYIDLESLEDSRISKLKKLRRRLRKVDKRKRAEMIGQLRLRMEERERVHLSRAVSGLGAQESTGRDTPNGVEISEVTADNRLDSMGGNAGRSGIN